MSCQSDSMKRRRVDFSHLAGGYGHLGSLDSNLPTCEASLAPSLHTRLGRPGWRRFRHWFESREQKLLNCVLGGGLFPASNEACALRAFCCHFKFLIPINEFQVSNLYQWNQWNIRWSRWSLGTSSILAARALRQRPATPGVGHQTQKSNQKSP